MILRYTYRTLITFSAEVSSHNFMLRCVPYPVDYQRVLTQSTSVIPHCTVVRSSDTFGNIVQTGYVADSHDAFMFESIGTIDVSKKRMPEVLNPLFKYPTVLTSLDADMLNVIKDIGAPVNGVDQWVTCLSDYLHSHLVYESGATSVTTTASQAFALGKGVCQDYTHIAIALCREVGIPARYVNGFMIGEGATHAWLEYYDGTVWQAYDPTNNRVVDDTYIKIAHGRDFDDCSINRGRFCGTAQQEIKVSLMVERVRKVSQ